MVRFQYYKLKEYEGIRKFHGKWSTLTKIGHEYSSDTLYL